MNNLESTIGFLVGFGVAWFVIRWITCNRWNAYCQDKPEVRKRRAIMWLKRYGNLTRDKYQKLTGVSDSQATRDMDELEAEGKVKQVGESGRFVKYVLTDQA